ncbi:MAG: dihydrouridine synthase [Archangium gephyra]|uniref:tRNA-dihydrouridine synthase n=1 Tax=Archangium gephyra TaxID=48 RepID=A0A2W5SNK9_9BACT|nr:MAG: dihydrouridine synthase [Archangium gephyra]
MLPWAQGTVPLMLAPMQGVTNRAVRQVFVDWVRPDVVFSEFMRVKHAEGAQRLSQGDLLDAKPHGKGVPLIVQLIGRDLEPLVEGAHEAQAAGAVHLNLNLGCPYGRMNVGCGGGMLERPEALPDILGALRAAIVGTFSVKVRSGYSDPEQIFSLLPVFEDAGVDFIALHARTVVQRYDGEADHSVTARVVKATSLPVIANGDLNSVEVARRVLHETGAAGLMMGRGAMRDPLLFERLRGRAPDLSMVEAHQHFLRALTRQYGALFGAEANVLSKLKSSLAVMGVLEDERVYRPLKKAKTVDDFCEGIEAMR